MLQFKDVAQTESTLETIGTVANFAGIGGYHELASDKNFKDTTKRVTLAIYNNKGQRVYVNCSKPLSVELRACKTTKELEDKLENVSSLPILKLPQIETDENSPNFGKPVMVTDEETGKQVPLVLYTISNQGGKDMSATRVTITEESIKKEIAIRAINFEDLIAI
jgi:uncharacterized protein (DUF302 family)